MKALSIVVVALVCISLVFSCGAAKSYRLPVGVDKARQTFAPIAACADRVGLTISEHPDSIHIRLDDTAWIQYMIQNQQYNMVLIVDEKKVPQNELQKKFDEARAKGDEIFACAQKTMKPGTPAPATAASPPAGSPASGPCEKLARCFSAIVNSLCVQAKDASCEASFKIEGEPDDEGCLEMLKNVPTLITPYKMAIPDYQVPAECK